MTLAGLHTVTRVHFRDDRQQDHVVLQGSPATPAAAERVTRLVDVVRRRAGLTAAAEVISASDFPTGVGLASSASAFAALTLAAVQAAGLELTPTDLSRLARRGSGSACRSIFGGFVEWLAGSDDQTSYATPLAPATHWPLVDLIAVVSRSEKTVGSTDGHRLASTSPLQAERVHGAEARLAACRSAIRDRDSTALAVVVELDSDLMHGVMETSSPPLRYRLPASHEVMTAVRRWRAEGEDVCYTLDAGPNVHCLCPVESADSVEKRLGQVDGVSQILRAGIGSAARLLPEEDPLTGLL
jgi:diphosphomevalonate decarboxylase